MNAQEEFRNFLEYYYLDYNVLTSIITFYENQNNSVYQTSFLLYTILNSLYDMQKICIPYSFAHIWDIKSGTKYYDRKINIIKDMSKGWYITEDEKQGMYVRVDKCGDIDQHFKEIYDSMKITENVNSIFNPSIELAFEKSILYNYYEKILPQAVNEKIINIYKEKKVKSLNDIFQFSYKIINILNVRNTINLNIGSKDELVKIIDLHIKNNLLLNQMRVKNIFDFETFYLKSIETIQQTEFSKKIFMYSILCDYIGITRESKKKIDKENFVTGMINDLLHLSYGMRCPIFVTNDKNLRIKAIICKILCNLNVKIFSIKNFYHYILNEYGKIKYPDKNNKEFSISCNIEGKTIIKIIKTDYEKIFFD